MQSDTSSNNFNNHKGNKKLMKSLKSETNSKTLPFTEENNFNLILVSGVMLFIFASAITLLLF